MNWRAQLGILLVAAIAVASLQFRWESASQDTQSQSNNSTNTTPDLQIETPVMEHFDEAGLLTWRVEGESLQYFEAEDRTEIQRPVAVIQKHNDQDKPTNGASGSIPNTPDDPWHLNAQAATLTQQHTQIALHGDAHVSNRDMTISSEQLLFDTNRQFATTDKAVTIQSRGSTAHADGLEADLTNKIVRLPARVKETHEPAKRK